LTQNPPTNVEGFTIVDDFLFRRTRLCIPNTSLRDHLFWEIHVGGIVGHFGRDKTIILMKDRFRACLFRCKTSQVASRKMRMEKVNCSRENILCFTVFG